MKVSSALKGLSWPSNAEASPSFKAQGHKDIRKPSKPCRVCIHWIALTEYSHMSTHVSGFQSYFRIFASKSTQ